MNIACQLHKRFEATTMEFFNAQVSNITKGYSNYVNWSCSLIPLGLEVLTICITIGD